MRFFLFKEKYGLFPVDEGNLLTTKERQLGEKERLGWEMPISYLPVTSRTCEQLLGNSSFLACHCQRKPWLSQSTMGATATSSVKVFYTLIVGNQGLGDGPVGKCSLCKFKELTLCPWHTC